MFSSISGFVLRKSIPASISLIHVPLMSSRRLKYFSVATSTSSPTSTRSDITTASSSIRLSSSVSVIPGAVPAFILSRCKPFRSLYFLSYASTAIESLRSLRLSDAPNGLVLAPRNSVARPVTPSL